MSDSKCSFGCPVEAALDVIGGKWKGIVLYHLEDGPKRFNELRRLVPGVTQRMLTRQLREMERDRLIRRKVYPVVPPKVEYSLDAMGASLMPIMVDIARWGREHMAVIGNNRRKAQAQA